MRKAEYNFTQVNEYKGNTDLEKVRDVFRVLNYDFCTFLNNLIYIGTKKNYVHPQKAKKNLHIT